MHLSCMQDPALKVELEPKVAGVMVRAVLMRRHGD
jgi:hypothetical protein